MTGKAPLWLLLIAQGISVAGDALGQRTSRIHHRRSRRHTTLSITLMNFLQMGFMMLLCEYALPRDIVSAVYVDGEKVTCYQEIDINHSVGIDCDAKAKTSSPCTEVECPRQGLISSILALYWYPLLILYGTINISYYSSEVLLYMQSLALLFLVLASLTSSFLINPMLLLFGMDGGDSISALVYVLGISGSLLCTLEIPTKRFKGKGVFWGILTILFGGWGKIDEQSQNSEDTPSKQQQQEEEEEEESDKVPLLSSSMENFGSNQIVKSMGDAPSSRSDTDSVSGLGVNDEENGLLLELESQRKSGGESERLSEDVLDVVVVNDRENRHQSSSLRSNSNSPTWESRDLYEHKVDDFDDMEEKRSQLLEAKNRKPLFRKGVGFMGTLVAIIVPFSVLSVSYAVWFVLQKIFDAKYHLNAFAFNSLDKAVLVLYLVPYLLFVDLCKPFKRVFESKEFWDESIYECYRNTLLESFGVKRFCTLFCFRALINGRSFLYFYLAVLYDLNTTYLELTLIRILFSWLGVIVVCLLIPKFSGTTSEERRKAFMPCSILLKSAGSVFIVFALLMMNGVF